jgi:hypothetical protein
MSRIIIIHSCKDCPIPCKDEKWDNNCPIKPNEIDNDVLVNNIELASSLSEESTFDEMIEKHLIIKEEEMFVDLGDGETCYTEATQDIFNRWYDYYREKIDELNQLK